jgi:hypothetical protein
LYKVHATAFCVVSSCFSFCYICVFYMFCSTVFISFSRQIGLSRSYALFRALLSSYYLLMWALVFPCHRPLCCHVLFIDHVPLVAFVSPRESFRFSF